MVSIRPYTPEDSEQASNVIIRCLREINSRDYTPGQVERLCQEFTPEKVQKRFSDRESFVAVQGDQVVGTATLKGDELGSVFVRPDLHGSGIGRHLTEHVEATARQNGMSVLRAYSSLAAIDFYAHLGYERLQEKLEPDGEVTIEIEKDLQA